MDHIHENKSQPGVQDLYKTMIKDAGKRVSNEVQSISKSTNHPESKVFSDLYQRVIDLCQLLPSSLPTGGEQVLPKLEYREAQWQKWAADIQHEQDIPQQEKVALLYADFRVLLAEVINSNDQLKPLYMRLKTNGWLGYEFRSQSVLSICDNYSKKCFPKNLVEIMRIIMKDFLETGVILDPDVVNSILKLPTEGKLRLEDQRKIDRIGQNYQKGVLNLAIGKDSSGQRLPLYEGIYKLLDKISINHKAEDRFLVYCRHKRLRDGENKISLNPPREKLYMSVIVSAYDKCFSHRDPKWLTYLLQEAISAGLFNEPHIVLDDFRKLFEKHGIC